MNGRNCFCEIFSSTGESRKEGRKGRVREGDRYFCLSQQFIVFRTVFKSLENLDYFHYQFAIEWENGDTFFPHGLLQLSDNIHTYKKTKQQQQQQKGPQFQKRQNLL